MRTFAIVMLAVSVLMWSAPSRADLVVTEAFHVDPGWEAGGYWEFTVNNMTPGDVYMIAVGNVDADLCVVRYPDVQGVWEPNRVHGFEWDSNEWPRRPTDWTTPDTSLFPFAVEFPGATQVLIYYVLGSNPPIGPGGVQTGFYFNYPLPPVTGAAPHLPANAGSYFLAFNGEGDVVARGQTVGEPLPTAHSTWGGIKTLFR